MVTSDSVRPGMSTPWKKPAVANRHDDSSSLNALTSAFLGRSRWVQDRDVDLGPHGFGRRVHRLPAGEQRQRAATGRGDQRDQLVVHRRGGTAAIGDREVHRAVEQRVVLVVERAADVDRSTSSAGRPTRSASDAGMVALVRIAVRCVQMPSFSTGPTSSGAISRRGVGATGDERDVALGERWRGRCRRSPRRQRLGAELALLGVLDRGVDRRSASCVATEARPRVGEDLLHGVGQRERQALADERGASASRSATAISATEPASCRVVEDPAHERRGAVNRPGRSRRRPCRS